MADVQFDLVPKFGDPNNSEPAKQGQVTINTYLDEAEFNRRVNNILRDDSDNKFVVYPYGRFAPTKKTFSVEENGMALMVKKDTPSAFKKNKKKDALGFRGDWYSHKGMAPKRDNYAHVFSSLNGMCLTDISQEVWKTLHEEEKKALIRKQFRVIGTIGTPYNYESKIGMAYFPTRLAGVFAVRNGSKPVSAGQYLMIDAPTPVEPDSTMPWKRDVNLQKLTDIPQDKVVMELVPFDPNHLPSLEVLEYYFDNKDAYAEKMKHINEVIGMKDKVGEEEDGGGNSDKEVEKLLEKLSLLNTVDKFLFMSSVVLMKLEPNLLRNGNYYKNANYKLFRALIDSFFLVRCEQKSRIVCRALTDAEPGAQLDAYFTEGYGN